jgi:hypothetical protein
MINTAEFFPFLHFTAAAAFSHPAIIFQFIFAG